MTSFHEFGDSLRQAREARGLSREDLFAQTRINLRHIRAIEEGDFPSVPLTYVRAFIREFARVCGLDEDGALATYNALAEELHGIPKPPEAIDNSNILPQMDDSVEIIVAGSVVPRHVEVQGRPEVEKDPFVQQVRRSTSITDDLTETIDIRVAPAGPRGMDADEAPPVDRDQLPLEFPDAVQEGAPPAAVAASQQEAGTPPVVDTPAAPASAPAAGKARGTATPTAAAPKPAAPEVRPASPPRQATRPAMQASRPAPQPAQADSPRRYILMAVVILAIIAIGIIASLLFTASPTQETGLLDSAGLQSSIDAGRLADSLQGAPSTFGLGDTISSDEPPEELAMEPTSKVYSSEDSLVLEAFSTSPVWFYIRMDTTRSERGTMSSNNHFIWKAKDQFTVTLGDAGSVTFYLNGQPLGTLGDENAVVKNVPISRRLLRNN